MSYGSATTFDCIIIGAGIYGIAAAKTYLALHPEHDVLIIESRPCLGGVWSEERGYDAFWTQTPVNLAAFASSPISEPADDDLYYGFFPARRATQYLEDFVDNHIYNGLSIRARIEFDTMVQNVRRDFDKHTWIVSTNRASALSTSKLMVCSGLTSVPNMPSLPGQESFRGTIIHHKDFGSSTVLSDPDIKHVAVLGGAKSAADVAYTAAKHGKSVSWIIRKSGSGPGALVPAAGVGPYKNSNELLYTRVTALFSPSIWVRRNWVTEFLHRSRIGRKVVEWIWDLQDRKTQTEAGFNQRSDGTSNGFENLQPDTSLFWGNDSSGVNQRPDFWSTIAVDNVQVLRDDITQIKDNEIVMTGATVTADAMVCGTGWRPSYYAFLDDDVARSLGLSVPIRAHQAAKEDSKMAHRLQSADDEICLRFPGLRQPPPHHKSAATETPFRLFKHMVPCNPKMSGIVFLGHIVVGNNFRGADCQALWAVAYLDGKVNLPDPEQMEREVDLSLAWCRRRYLEKGKLGHWLYFDLVPYTDALLEQLELKSHRSKGWWKDFVSPCIADDLSGCLEELREKHYTAVSVQ